MTATSPEEDIARARAGIRATLEERIADRERQAAERIADRDLASFDTPAFARVLRPLLDADGRGWGAIALDAGVTTPDLSRIMSGQAVSAAKVFALADWAGLEARKFYRPPRRLRPASRGAPAAKPPAAPAGRRTSGGGQSPAMRPSAEVFHVGSTETAAKALKPRRSHSDRPEPGRP
jgi:hypothetical protein